MENKRAYVAPDIMIESFIEDNIMCSCGCHHRKHKRDTKPFDCPDCDCDD